MKPRSSKLTRPHRRPQRRHCARPTWRASSAWLQRPPGAASAWAAPTSRTPSPRCPPTTSCASSPRSAPHLAVVTRLQRHAVGAPALRGLPGADPRRGARARRHGAGGRRRAGHVRRRHPGPARHGAVLFSRDNIAHGHRRGADARRVRRRAAAGRVRQDRARAADRRAALRPPALCLRARRADDHRACRTTPSPRCASSTRKGLVGRDELLEAESAAYHGAGTCTFYGTANSNQMLLEAMGLHVPGAAFVHPHARLREALTREAVAHGAGASRAAAALHARSAAWSTSA